MSHHERGSTADYLPVKLAVVIISLFLTLCSCLSVAGSDEDKPAHGSCHLL